MKHGLALVGWLLAAGALTMALGPWWEPLHALVGGDRRVAIVDGVVIRQSDVSSALRERLWLRGEAWHSLAPKVQQECRQQALEALVRQQLVRLTRKRGPASPIATDDELHWFQRQLAFSEGRYAESLAGQGLDETLLLRQMEAKLLDQGWIESSLTSSTATVSDSDARAWFEANHRVLLAPEAFRAAHLFLSSHDPAQPDRHRKIQQIEAEVRADKSVFEQRIEELSEDERTKHRGGDLGWFTSARMPADFVSACASLRPGEISAPVQTDLGWHLIKLIDRKPARPLTFEEVKDEIVAHLTNARRQAAVSAFINDLRHRARMVEFADALAAVRLED